LARLTCRPSPATVISLIALFVALGGTGYAAIKLPKNSVGSKQIKKNAVTGAKVKADTLTGADILESSLAKVPSATAADTAAKATSADSATKAASADKATTADTATNLAPAENWHEVGAPGEPAFETGCENSVVDIGDSSDAFEKVAFMKDKLGFVHLKGVFDCSGPGASGAVFRLPEGYRPANGKLVVLTTACGGCTDGGGDSVSTGQVQIAGPGIQTTPIDATGLVLGLGEIMALDGLSFKPGS
jgi:hypothetical protein